MPESDHKYIGPNIRKWRALLGYKQRDLAKASGISISTLSKIENNKASVSLIKLQKIAGCLNLKITQLFMDPVDVLLPTNNNT